MTQTIQSIEDQIAQLEADKLKLINTEKTAKITEIKKLIKQYGITASQLGLTSKDKSDVEAEPKKVYYNPKDDTQTYKGQGRKPKWIDEYLANGGAIDKLPTRLQ